MSSSTSHKIPNIKADPENGPVFKTHLDTLILAEEIIQNSKTDKENKYSSLISI